MASLDHRLLRALRTRGHARPLETAAIALAKFGNNGQGWFATGLVLAAADRGRAREWLACGALGPAAIVLNFGVKTLVKRPRPVLEGLPPLGGAPSGLSFPSAHATASFAVAAAMTRVDRRARVAFVPAVAVAVGRPYLGMHYPSDVLAGTALGLALGLTVPLPGQPAPGLGRVGGGAS
jgi:membrane-associated phospholipid phosphatase